MGLQLGFYGFSSGDDQPERGQVFSSVNQSGVLLQVSYHITRHLDVQTGLFFGNSGLTTGGSPLSTSINDSVTLQTSRRFGQRPFYLPLRLRYMPFGNHRRIQPYLMAGTHVFTGRIEKKTIRYDPRTANTGFRVYESGTDKEGIKSLFGVSAGLGLQVRVVNRFSLSLEGAAGRNLSSRDGWLFTGGFGLAYDLPAKR